LLCTSWSWIDAMRTLAAALPVFVKRTCSVEG
jgi:hypothetical protein